MEATAPVLGVGAVPCSCWGSAAIGPERPVTTRTSVLRPAEKPRNVERMPLWYPIFGRPKVRAEQGVVGGGPGTFVVCSRRMALGRRRKISLFDAACAAHGWRGDAAFDASFPGDADVGAVPAGRGLMASHGP